MDPRLAQSDDPEYRSQVDPVTSDKTRRVVPVQNLRAVNGGPIALDNATTDKDFRIHGDFLYADPSSSGVITVKLNSSAEPAFQMSAQAALVGMPMKDIFLSWSGQAGKSILLFYGYGARFQPPQQTIATIGAILSTVNVSEQGPAGYGASFANNTAQAANTAVQVFAAGSNPNGAILWNAGIWINGGAAGIAGSLLAKNGAPTTLIDGDVYCSVSIPATAGVFPTVLPRLPIRVPANKGLYFFNTALEVTCAKWAEYTLL